MKLIVFCITLTIVTCCHGDKTVEYLSKGHNQFAVDIFYKIQDLEKNVIFGPISLSSAMAMTTLGASEQAEQEILNAFNLGTQDPGYLEDKLLAYDDADEALHLAFKNLSKILYKDSDTCDLRSANGLFIENTYSFNDIFLSAVASYYDAELDQVDFVNAYEDVRENINQWVMSKTNDKIQDLIPQGAVSPLTAMVIVNALYFKGLWKTPFKADKTSNMRFYTSSDTSKCATMMHTTSTAFGYSDNLFNSKVLRLPYNCQDADRKLNMYIILPNTVDGLKDLEADIELDPNNLESLLSSALSRESSNHEVKVWLPRFTFTYDLSVTSILADLDIKSIFQQGGLVGMSDNPNLVVSDVIHKAFIEVNEEGTEAAAATGAIFRSTSFQMPKPPKIFRADHPFLFVIREDTTGAILFMGHVIEPNECEDNTVAENTGAQSPETPDVPADSESKAVDSDDSRFNPIMGPFRFGKPSGQINPDSRIPAVDPDETRFNPAKGPFRFGKPSGQIDPNEKRADPDKRPVDPKEIPLVPAQRPKDPQGIRLFPLDMRVRPLIRYDGSDGNSDEGDVESDEGDVNPDIGDDKLDEGDADIDKRPLHFGKPSGQIDPNEKRADPDKRPDDPKEITLVPAQRPKDPQGIRLFPLDNRIRPLIRYDGSDRDSDEGDVEPDEGDVNPDIGDDKVDEGDAVIDKGDAQPDEKPSDSNAETEKPKVMSMNPIQNRYKFLSEDLDFWPPHRFNFRKPTRHGSSGHNKVRKQGKHGKQRNWKLGKQRRGRKW